ncbi:50S ribosomal protein L11 [Haladaptatus sp. F3-133]|jgi:large subunit ribosomal protein L11|uniref:Large ribosomal subunit protein uL11 n=1 Tax=Halorutilus salinus TaxID=2487751 RepID=A0A9Q4GGZ8_9EURY|nr:50S ribosomal protein L11 [Halorutilus salinus]MCX2819664.1 50S ribosomal protein L11 [Halorutilus salinus]
MAETIELLVEGGEASAGPPLGPALGPTEVNVGQVVQAINEETADFEGTEVPVTVTVEEGDYEIEVGLPPTSALIKDELGFETGSGRPQAEFVAEMSAEELKKVAEMKSDDLLSYDTKNAAKEVAGSCVPLGVRIEGEDPREAARRIDEGEFDDVLA